MNYKLWLYNPRVGKILALVLVMFLLAMPNIADAQDPLWCGMDGCWSGDGNGGTGYVSDGSVEGLLFVIAMNAAILACLVFELGCFTWLVW